MPSILMFGATGFLGAPLTRQLKKAHPDWPVTAYARSNPEDVKTNLGVDHVVTGDYSEFEKIKDLSKQYDIVFNAGNSFTDEPVAAIAAGLKESPGDSKGKMIHISGGGNFIDFGTSGSFNPDSKVWSDEKENDIKLVNKDMFNGPSDTVVLDAGKDGAVETYIVCIPVTYGGATVGSKGIGVGYSLITGNAIPLGYAPYVGDGSAVLATIHVLDAVPFLLKIIEKAASGPAEGSVYSRWYNIQSERVTWKALATELAKIMYGKGVFKSPEPKSVPMEQAGEGEVKHLVAANMLMEGPRAAKLGFKPTHPSILVQMREDLKDAQF